VNCLLKLLRMRDRINSRVSDEEDALVAVWAGVVRFLNVLSVILLWKEREGKAFERKMGKAGGTLCSTVGE
jgi:hypothetical protein